MRLRARYVLLGTITVPPVEIAPRALVANASERLELRAQAWGAQRLLKLVRGIAAQSDQVSTVLPSETTLRER